MKGLIIGCLIIGIFIISSCQISEDIKVKTAKNYAKELGYDPSKMNVEYSKEDKVTYWKEYINNVEGDEFSELKQKLETRDYVAMYLSPKDMMLGGDLVIFIDSETNEVLGYIGFK